MRIRNIALAATIGSLTALNGAVAQDTLIERVEIGVLDCVVSGGTGYIFGSTKDVGCTYKPADGAPEETYFGVISKYGVDIGTTEASYMTWAVLAPTDDPYRPGALAGDYFGVSAEATVGAGIGANALLGGSDETIALQPLSVSGQTGLNFALGVSELELRSSAD
ncbi:DUF992 domain-containing protein [Oricola cellulosilytica]|uniref:DUF992 domain-containing protein n=1 Tax=Oricola cellulosilytica TaxID=1429082 RepID=A0A4R0PHM7_9HYPH|nr:DUF992 domain-containing protein [Oricola cellulosilytica]TCD15074.1 DUF992 domain-containing protein [Oricola cellulosilytica]